MDSTHLIRSYVRVVRGTYEDFKRQFGKRGICYSGSCFSFPDGLGGEYAELWRSSLVTFSGVPLGGIRGVLYTDMILIFI